MSSKFRHKLEYFPVWLLATGLGVLPRALARSLCQGIGLLHQRGRRLQLAREQVDAHPGAEGERQLAEAGITLLEAIHPVIYVFGAVLLLAAVNMLRGGTHAPPEQSRVPSSPPRSAITRIAVRS